MFQKSKIARTRIADLPESLSQLVIKELDNVAGDSRLVAYRGSGSMGLYRIRINWRSSPCLMHKLKTVELELFPAINLVIDNCNFSIRQAPGATFIVA